ncbi:hypothetical protein [Clostridium tertium]|uniref:hypothetical protein n=1 Tax=Clostridium tertium TaxID=1559 RepID=UPI000DD097A7|nr:hypothetical protein [Clostridium tertium]
MNKVYCNKETDMVEQILKVKTYDELADDYFNTCYAIIDEDEKVNAYNLRYNKKAKDFEVVEGIRARDEVTVEKNPTKEDFDSLKQENEDLKARLERIENVLNQVMTLDNI